MDKPIIEVEKIQFDDHSQMNISFEETISLENSSSSQIIQTTIEDSSSSLSIEDKSIELSSIDNHRERTMSDTSSDTVDYDFDTETCTKLTFESQQSSISLSDCHDSNS